MSNRGNDAHSDDEDNGDANSEILALASDLAEMTEEQFEARMAEMESAAGRNAPGAAPIAAAPIAVAPIAAAPIAAAPIAGVAPVAATLNAVFFGWRQHPGTTIWREIIQQLSQIHVDPNTRPNPNDIVIQVRQLLAERGINTYHVDENPIQREDGRTQLSGDWRPATEEEIASLTKKR